MALAVAEGLIPHPFILLASDKGMGHPAKDNLNKPLRFN
jgi:hypothetical protein